MSEINPFKDSGILLTEEEANEVLNEISEKRREYSDAQVSKFVKSMRDSPLFSGAEFDYTYDFDDDMFYIIHVQATELSDCQFNFLVNNQIEYLDDEEIINYSIIYKRKETVI